MPEYLVLSAITHLVDTASCFSVVVLLRNY